jgi:hypothetical protein
MIRLIFLLALVAAMIATVVLVVSRPVKLLAKIQIILTAIVVVAVLSNFEVAMWLHSMAYADPIRQEWQPRFSVIGAILWFGTIIPWLLFTIFHVIVVLRRKQKAGI